MSTNCVMHPFLTDLGQMVPDADWNCRNGGLNRTRALAISFFLTSACQLSKVEQSSSPQPSWHLGQNFVEDNFPMVGGGNGFRMVQAHYVYYAAANMTGGGAQAVMRAIRGQL